MDDKRNLVESAVGIDITALPSTTCPEYTVRDSTSIVLSVVTPTPAPILPSRQTTSTRAEQSLRAKELLPLRVFAFICLLVFPPTGVAALYYALRTGDEYARAQEIPTTSRVGPSSTSAQGATFAYDVSLMREATKHAHTTERLIIFSLVLGLMMYVFIVGLIERRINNVGDMPIVDHSMN